MEYEGFANASKTGDIRGERDVRVRAGLFEFNVSENTSGEAYWDEELQAFCIDVSTNLVTSGQVHYLFEVASESDYLDNLQRSLIAQLFDNHAGALGDAEADAAFQLALWEIIYDPTSLDLTDSQSNFWVASAFSGARDLAASWLKGLDSTNDAFQSSHFEFYVLRPWGDVPNQTLLTWRPVPEPALLALLGGGLLLIAVARRRRPTSAGIGAH